MAAALSSPSMASSSRPGTWRKSLRPERDSLFRSAAAQLLLRPASGGQGQRIEGDFARSMDAGATSMHLTPSLPPQMPVCGRGAASKRLGSSTCSSGVDQAHPGLHHVETPPELERLLDYAEVLPADISMESSSSTRPCVSQFDVVGDNVSEAGTDSTAEPYSELDDLLELSHATYSSCASSQATCSPRRARSYSGSSSTAVTPQRVFSCNSGSHQSACGSASGSGKAKYWSQKSCAWFKDIIDADGLGQVDFRRFLSALRRYPGLQSALAEAAGVPFSEEDQSAHKRLRVGGLLGPSVEERTDILLKERSRIKQIFQKMCDAPDHTLDMSSFLEFFYKRGLILDSM